MGDSSWNDLLAPIALFASSGIAVTLIRRLAGAITADSNTGGGGDGDDTAKTGNENDLLSSAVLQFASLPPECSDAFYDLYAHALSSAPCGDRCECECGFQRPEFKNVDLEKLAYHDHHVFICRGMKSTDWSANVEQEDPICRELSTAFRKIRKSVRVKMSVVEEGTRAEAGEETDEMVDLLIFPDAVRYVGVRRSQVTALVTSHFVHKKLFTDVPHEQIDGSHIFVCCHHKRDMRCAACGPRVYKALVEKVSTLFSSGSGSGSASVSLLHPKCRSARVYRTSCVTGHKYAGNVIVFKYSPEMKKYFGDWYGCVNDAEDVDRLVDSHLVRGDRKSVV